MTKRNKNQNKKAKKVESKAGAGTISTAKVSNNHFNDDNPIIATSITSAVLNTDTTKGFINAVEGTTTYDTGHSFEDHNVSIAAACNDTLGLNDDPEAAAIPNDTTEVPNITRGISDVIGSITTMETKSGTEDQNYLIAVADDYDQSLSGDKVLVMSTTPSSATLSESSSLTELQGEPHQSTSEKKPYQFTSEQLLEVSPMHFSDSEDMSCSFSLAEQMGSLPPDEIYTLEHFLEQAQLLDWDHFSPTSVAQQPPLTPTSTIVPSITQELLDHQTVTAFNSPSIQPVNNTIQAASPSQATSNLTNFPTTFPTEIQEVFNRLASHYAMIKPSDINASVTHYATHNAVRDLQLSISMLKEDVKDWCQWLLHIDKKSWNYLDNLRTEDVMLSDNKYSLQGHIPALEKVIDTLLASPQIRNLAAANFPSVESFDEYVTKLQGADIPFAAYFIMFLRVYDFAQEYLHLIAGLKRYRATRRDPTLSHYDLTNLYTSITTLSTAATFLDVHLEHTVPPLPRFMDEQDTVIARIKESLAVHHVAHKRNLDLVTLLPVEVRTMPWYKHVERIVTLQNSTSTSQDFLSYLTEVQKDMYYIGATTNNLRSIIMMVYLSYYSLGTNSLKAAVRKVCDDSQPIITIPLHSPSYPSELDSIRSTLYQKRNPQHHNKEASHLTQRMIATVITMAFQDHRRRFPTPSSYFSSVAQLLRYEPDALHQQLLRLFRNAETSSSRLYLILSFDNIYPCDYHVFVFSLFTLYDTLGYHWPHVTDHYAIQLGQELLTVDIFEPLTQNAQRELLLFQQSWQQRHQRSRTRLLHVFHDTHKMECIFPGSHNLVKKHNLLHQDLETNYTIALSTKLILKVVNDSKEIPSFNVTPMSTSDLQVFDDSISMHSSSSPTSPEYDAHELGDDAISVDSYVVQCRTSLHSNVTTSQPTTDSPTHPPYSPLTQVTSTADPVAASEAHFNSMTTCLDSPSNSERNSSITTDNDHDQPSQVNADTLILNVLQTIPVASDPTHNERKRSTLPPTNSSHKTSQFQPDDEGEGTQSPFSDVNPDTIGTSYKRARSDSEGRQR